MSCPPKLTELLRLCWKVTRSATDFEINSSEVKVTEPLKLRFETHQRISAVFNDLAPPPPPPPRNILLCALALSFCSRLNALVIVGGPLQALFASWQLLVLMDAKHGVPGDELDLETALRAALKKVKPVYSASWETHLRATEVVLYNMSVATSRCPCHVLSATRNKWTRPALTPARQSIYLPLRNGRLSWPR